MTTSPRPKRTLWPIWLAIPTMLLVGLFVAVTTGLLIWLALGHPGFAKGWDTSTQLDVVRIALIVTGGIGGIVYVVAYRKQRISERSDEREDSRLFNERFMTACGALGHESAAVRLAAVTAIARLADDWVEERQQCIDVLCSYLRLPYEPVKGQDGWKDGEQEVRWSIIRSVRDHLRYEDENLDTWRGSDFDFTGAVFDGGDFTRATFLGGNVSFGGAAFVGGNVSFDGAFLGGKVSFDGATFSGGNVSFTRLSFAERIASSNRLSFAERNMLRNSLWFSARNVSFDEATLSGGSVTFDEEVLDNPPLGFRLPPWLAGNKSPVSRIDQPPPVSSGEPLEANGLAPLDPG